MTNRTWIPRAARALGSRLSALGRRQHSDSRTGRPPNCRRWSQRTDRCVTDSLARPCELPQQAGHRSKRTERGGPGGVLAALPALDVPVERGIGASACALMSTSARTAAQRSEFSRQPAQRRRGRTPGNGPNRAARHARRRRGARQQCWRTGPLAVAEVFCVLSVAN